MIALPPLAMSRVNAVLPSDTMLIALRDHLAPVSVDLSEARGTRTAAADDTAPGKPVRRKGKQAGGGSFLESVFGQF